MTTRFIKWVESRPEHRWFAEEAGCRTLKAMIKDLWIYDAPDEAWDYLCGTLRECPRDLLPKKFPWELLGEGIPLWRRRDLLMRYAAISYDALPGVDKCP